MAVYGVATSYLRMLLRLRSTTNSLPPLSRPWDNGPLSLILGRRLVLRRFVLLAGSVLVASGAHASPYQDALGIVLDPILDYGGSAK